MPKESILIIGAGLCGSLLALRLGQRGFKVRVLEMRPDLRTVDISAGRSINLAFSNRGLKAINLVGLESKVKRLCIPMHGRMIHDKDGKTFLSNYMSALMRCILGETSRINFMYNRLKYNKYIL